MQKTRKLALALVLALGGCASASDSERSPLGATLMAIFPGFFVHGAGNMYAGKGVRGSELLEEEGLGMGCLVLGAGLGGLGYLAHTQADRAKNNVEMVFDRMGEATSFIGSAGFVGYGLICFFDSWIRDIMEAGDAAESHNLELKRHEPPQPLPADSIADLTSAGAPSGAHNLDIPR